MKWATVRAFGSVKYFNISYVILVVVPIIAEFYTRASECSDLFAETVAFPKALVWLYVGSLCYAIAIAIYQYRCPAEIKRFGNSDEYLDNSYEMFLRSHPHHRLSIVLANLDQDVDGEIRVEIEHLLHEREQSTGHARVQKQQQLDAVLKALHGDAVQRYLLRDYDQKNVKRPIALWLSFLLYVIGTIILLGLLVERSIHVIDLLGRD